MTAHIIKMQGMHIIMCVGKYQLKYLWPEQLPSFNIFMVDGHRCSFLFNI